MSHISTFKYKMKNLDVLKRVCEVKGYQINMDQHSVAMYEGQRVENVVASFHLPGWQYDIAVDNEGGVYYDHWGSSGGQNSFRLLGRTVQAYNEEVIMDAAMSEGHLSWIEDAEEGWKEVIVEVA